MSKLNKQLIALVAENGEMSKGAAAHAVKHTINALKQVIKEEDSVRVEGLGSFSHKTRKAREIKMPTQAKPVLAPEKTVLRFTPFKTFTDSLNNG